ncbi:hypothetical protein FL583_06420 [Cryptosporangium phraense]|uniref:Cytochrome P450 n=1 Tax=Cryptosporangium phraense TaxID=2593070 RepID=A0A545AY28_9ACTN|nr:hypothetical protein FL583_06420 [Cryptosporangium phraense]
MLTSPTFAVPGVPPGDRGVGWLRASVARFSSGEPHRRRRALVVDLLATVPPDALRSTESDDHPVATLARALGLDVPVALVADVAQAYQPGTGDEPRADAAVDRLVDILGGDHDEATAARIGLLVQACQATTTLIERARTRPIDDVLRDDPPAPTTKRVALTPTRLGDLTVDAGEVVLVALADGLAFGAGEHRCPGRAHALALAHRAATSGRPES